MKLFYRLTLLLIGLATIYSCSEDDFDRTPVLDLSEKALNFAREASAGSIDVTVNDGDDFFSVVSPAGAGWVSVAKTAGQLKVNVTEHKGVDSRVATIEVLLNKGDKRELITVTQTGDAGYINAPSEVVYLANTGESVTVYIDSNAQWVASVEGDTPWLAIGEQSKGKLVVRASDSDIAEMRAGSIKLVASGGVEATVNVIQKGAIYYDFPFLKIGYNYDGPEAERGIIYKNSMGDANAFEKARGSVMYENANLGFYFNTRSTLFPTVGYGAYSSRGSAVYPSVRAVSISCSIKPFALLEDPAFLEYMEGEGFEFAWRNDADEIATYWDREREIALQFIDYEDEYFGNRLTFTHARTKPNDPTNQTDTYPTFTSMPESYLEFGGTLEDILAWEATKGSKMAAESDDSYAIFIPDPAREPYCIERVYGLSNNTMTDVLLILNHVDKAYYFTGDMYDETAYSITAEFTQLMVQDGYMLVMARYQQYAFYNPEKEIMKMSSVERYTTEGRLPRLTIQIMPYSM